MTLRTARWLALAGVIGPVVFVASFTLAGFIRPGYSPVHTAISALGVGPNAWLEDIPAFLLGLSVLGFTLSFVHTMRPEMSGASLGASGLLLTIFGLVWIIVSIFTSAPSTRSVHVVASIVGEIAVTAAFFVIAIGLKGTASWHRWPQYSGVAGVVTLVLVVLAFLASASRKSDSGSLTGLAERAMVIEVLVWFVIFGWKLFTNRSVTVSRASGL